MKTSTSQTLAKEFIMTLSFKKKEPIMLLSTITTNQILMRELLILTVKKKEVERALKLLRTSWIMEVEAHNSLKILVRDHISKILVSILQIFREYPSAHKLLPLFSSYNGPLSDIL